MAVAGVVDAAEPKVSSGTGSVVHLLQAGIQHQVVTETPSSCSADSKASR